MRLVIRLTLMILI